MIAIRGTILMALGCALAGGCIHRQLTVKSDPPGALVELNGREVGRTPMTREFLWYGDYDVALRLEGYQTVKTHARVYAPWWQWVPLDFFTSMLPVTDEHRLIYTLTPATTRPGDAEALLRRAARMKSQLQGPDESK